MAGSIKQINYTPPPVESKADPELAGQLHIIHQQIFNAFGQHGAYLSSLQDQITALQAQIKAQRL